VRERARETSVETPTAKGTICSGWIRSPSRHGGERLKVNAAIAAVTVGGAVGWGCRFAAGIKAAAGSPRYCGHTRLFTHTTIFHSWQLAGGLPSAGFPRERSERHERS